MCSYMSFKVSFPEANPLHSELLLYEGALMSKSYKLCFNMCIQTGLSCLFSWSICFILRFISVCMFTDEPEIQICTIMQYGFIQVIQAYLPAAFLGSSTFLPIFNLSSWSHGIGSLAAAYSCSNETDCPWCSEQQQQW